MSTPTPIKEPLAWDGIGFHLFSVFFLLTYEKFNENSFGLVDNSNYTKLWNTKTTIQFVLEIKKHSHGSNSEN